MRPRRAVARTASALVAALALTVGLGGPAVAAHEAEAGPATTGTGSVTHEENDRVPEGSVWTQHYFPSADRSGTRLHADVLLPEGLKRKEKVPVILSIGPYFAHAGQTGPEGWSRTGPPPASRTSSRAPTCSTRGTPSSWWTCVASGAPPAVWTGADPANRRT